MVFSCAGAGLLDSTSNIQVSVSAFGGISGTQASGIGPKRVSRHVGLTRNLWVISSSQGGVKVCQRDAELRQGHGRLRRGTARFARLNSELMPRLAQ